MDSIDKGATIRIGFREYYKPNSLDVDFSVPTYSLKIDKKTIINSSGGGRSDDYIKIYQEAAKDIAQRMNEHGVKEFVIYNGERVRFSNKKWESCGYIPNDGELIFKKTLESYLK